MVPAVSRAVTVRTLAPVWRTMPPAVQLVVPVAVPVPPRLFAQVTWVAPAAAAPGPPSARVAVGVGSVVRAGVACRDGQDVGAGLQHDAAGGPARGAGCGSAAAPTIRPGHLRHPDVIRRRPPERQG